MKPGLKPPSQEDLQLFQQRAAWNERFVEQCLHRLHTAPNAEEGLRRLLAYLGESLECDRVYVFEEMDRQHISNTYEWCSPGVSSGIEELPYLDKKDLHPWYDWLTAGETVVEKDVSSLKHTHPLIGDILTRQQIHTIVLSPLMTGGFVRGLLGADNPPLERMEQIPVLFGVLANFVLGLVSQRDLAKLRLSQTPQRQPPGAPRMKGKKLLLVDDSQELLRLNARVLRPEGYSIRLAACLKEARVLLASEPPDVIVMDVDLPDGNGIDFCQELRKTSDIPVVFLTARSDAQTALKGRQTSGCAFLTKPYRLEELRTVVADSVGGKHNLQTPNGGKYAARLAAQAQKEEII